MSWLDRLSERGALRLMEDAGFSDFRVQLGGIFVALRDGRVDYYFRNARHAVEWVRAERRNPRRRRGA